MKPTKYYYALQWPMGYCMRQLQSGRSVEYCIPWRFTTRAERDTWIAKGGAGMRSPNYREQVRRRDISSAIDRAQQFADQHRHSEIWNEEGRLYWT
jgi:hypothetical protein